MVDLASINLALDIILKLIAITTLVFVFLMLRNLDRAVQKLERSMGSVERSAETVEDVVRIARKLPFVGGKKNHDK